MFRKILLLLIFPLVTQAFPLDQLAECDVDGGMVKIAGIIANNALSNANNNRRFFYGNIQIDNGACEYNAANEDAGKFCNEVRPAGNAPFSSAYLNLRVATGNIQHITPQLFAKYRQFIACGEPYPYDGIWKNLHFLHNNTAGYGHRSGYVAVKANNAQDDSWAYLSR